MPDADADRPTRFDADGYPIVSGRQNGKTAARDPLIEALEALKSKISYGDMYADTPASARLQPDAYSMSIDDARDFAMGYNKQPKTSTIKAICLFGPMHGFKAEEVDAVKTPQNIHLQSIDPSEHRFEEYQFGNPSRPMVQRTIHVYTLFDVMSSAAEAEDVAIYTHSERCPCLT